MENSACIFCKDLEQAAQKNIGFKVKFPRPFATWYFRKHLKNTHEAMFTKKTQSESKRSSKRTVRRSRKGAAVVEAALCIPVIIILMLGTVEISSRFYLKESLTIAAYEGARTGAKRRATRAQVIQRVEDILAARNVDLGNSGTITVTPTDLSTLDALDPLTVTVTCPPTGNCSMVFDGIAATSNMTASVKMAREFDH